MIKFDPLSELILEFKSNDIDVLRMDKNDINKIFKICNQRDSIIWINEYTRIQPLFLNDAGLEYYGFTREDMVDPKFDFYSRFIHEDHFTDVRKTIVFFDQNPKHTFKYPYRVKNKYGDYVWTYSVARALNFAENGSPIYILAVVYDIEESLARDNSELEASFIRENQWRYNSLTKRELQVMKMIASEMTSPEIGKALHIEASTVDTHRKHIISKLNVKSSVGLVKYAHFFSDIKV